MSTMQTWLRLVYAAILMSFVIGCDREREFWEGPGGRTVSIVYNLRNCLSAHLLDYDSSMLDSDAISSKVIEDCKKDIPGIFKQNERGQIIDAWERPLRIEISPDNKDGRPRVRVWSMGENGLDENGNGDDILRVKF
jgi:hypothetical protein